VTVRGTPLTSPPAQSQGVSVTASFWTIQGAPADLGVRIEFLDHDLPGRGRLTQHRRQPAPQAAHGVAQIRAGVQRGQQIVQGRHPVVPDDGQQEIHLRLEVSAPAPGGPSAALTEYSVY